MIKIVASALRSLLLLPPPPPPPPFFRLFFRERIFPPPSRLRGREKYSLPTPWTDLFGSGTFETSSSHSFLLVKVVSKAHTTFYICSTYVLKISLKTNLFHIDDVWSRSTYHLAEATFDNVDLCRRRHNQVFTQCIVLGLYTYTVMVILKSARVLVKLRSIRSPFWVVPAMRPLLICLFRQRGTTCTGCLILVAFSPFAAGSLRSFRFWWN